MKVNSQKLKLPSGKTLKGNDRQKFEVSRIKLDVLKSELICFSFEFRKTNRIELFGF